VLIESRIVVVNDDFSRDLGVRLGVTTENIGPRPLLVTSGTGTGANNYMASILNSANDPTGTTPIEFPSLSDRLSALEAEGRGEIVSTPRVITANQSEATIKQGVEIPYQQASSSGATTVQFKEAVLELVVTPQITPDNNIIMDLRVSKDNVGQIISTGGLGGTVPSIDTRSVETQVLVANGQTVVLGGIYETERRETVKKVPLLGDIPFVGALFRSKQRTDNKAELLIFVTPRILEEGSSIY